MDRGSNLGAYLQRFGLLAGYGLYLSTKMKRGVRTIEIPGMAKLIYMRTGTSDRSAFNEVIVKRWYCPARFDWSSVKVSLGSLFAGYRDDPRAGGKTDGFVRLGPLGFEPRTKGL